MSQVMQFEFRLFGPRKGQTININGHHFVDGRALLIQSSENMGACMRVLSFYGAYARGNADYNEALAKEEAENGTNEVDPQAVERVDASVRSGVRPDGPGLTEEAPAVSVGSVDTDGASSSGGDTDRDGHGHAGVPKFPEDTDYRLTEPASEVNLGVKTAIQKLDPEVDSHWVQTGAHAGKPKLQAVEEAFGKAGLTRQDIEAALPGWNRGVATEAVLAA